MLIFFILIFLITCDEESTSPRESFFNPPQWIHGTWEYRGEYQTITDDNEIITVNGLFRETYTSDEIISTRQTDLISDVYSTKTLIETWRESGISDSDIRRIIAETKTETTYTIRIIHALTLETLVVSTYIKISDTEISSSTRTTSLHPAGALVSPMITMTKS